jgi:hypothetical protein
MDRCCRLGHSTNNSRERNPEIRQRILDYNEDDCRATRVRELNLKRNSCQGANAQVIRMAAAAAPHARLRFHRCAIFSSHGPHRHALEKTRAGHAACHEQLPQYPSARSRAPHGVDQLEAACRRGNDIGARSYGSIASILQHGLDRAYAQEKVPEGAPIRHANIRGRRYYH